MGEVRFFSASNHEGVAQCPPNEKSPLARGFT
jgi:hypothetical protein